VGGSTARSIGSNAKPEVAGTGAGGDARRVGAALPGFPSSDPGWSARGGSGVLSGGVLVAFSSGREGTDGEGTYDRMAVDEVAFAGGGPARRATAGAARGKGLFGCAGNNSPPRTGTCSGMETTGVVPGGAAISRGTAVWGNGAATAIGNGATGFLGTSLARPFARNAWAEIAGTGAGDDGGTVAAGLSGFLSSDLSGSARGWGEVFIGGVLEAFSSGREGTDGDGTYDRAAEGEVAFAVGGPARLAAEGLGDELSLETTGEATGARLSHREGAGSLTGAPHISQNSPLRSSGPLQKLQIGSSAAWGVNRLISPAPANPNCGGVASASSCGVIVSPSLRWAPH